MATTMGSCRQQLALLLLLLGACSVLRLTAATNVGVNYGTLGNNLPPPTQVAQLLLSTSLRNVKIYNPDQTILQAFANTNIKLVVGVGTESIPLLASSPAAAQAWVQANIAAYMPATMITAIAVGNEVLTTAPAMASQLVPAMTNIHTALVNLKLDAQVKVGTPQNLQVLAKSFPPSSGTFRSNITSTMMDLLAFLAASGGSIMVNSYPYFAYRDDPQNVSLAYALFQPTAAGVTDINTGLHYSNMLDAQLDAVYSAMERLGYHSVPIVVSETGWPSAGDPAELAVSAANAQAYNEAVIRHITSGVGTPLRPGMSPDTYLFALFNENMKPGPGSERAFGIFNPDKTVAYDLGLTTGTTSPPTPYAPIVTYPPPSPSPMYPSPMYPSPSPVYASPPVYSPAPVVYAPPPPVVYTPPPPAYVYPPPSPPSSPEYSPSPPYSPSPSPAAPAPPVSPAYKPPSSASGKTWCVAKPGAPASDMMNALNFACGEGGADCGAIQPGGACYNPNSVPSHASYAFNSYYQKMGRNYWNCYFGNTGVITITDPSYTGCNFL